MKTKWRTLREIMREPELYKVCTKCSEFAFIDCEVCHACKGKEFSIGEDIDCVEDIVNELSKLAMEIGIEPFYWEVEVCCKEE